MYDTDIPYNLGFCDSMLCDMDGDQSINCHYCRKYDESTWAVDAVLKLPKRFWNSNLQYKFYVHAGKDDSKNYEHITCRLEDNGNRCLIPHKSYSYDPRGEYFPQQSRLCPALCSSGVHCILIV